jgi:hypothetical protein
MSRGSFMGVAFPLGLAMRALYGAAEAAVQSLMARAPQAGNGYPASHAQTPTN